MEAQIKLTKTMLDKAIIDANNSVREFVKVYGVDFNKMKSGDRATLEARFGSKDKPWSGSETVINLYRTNNARGDRRISIKGIKSQAEVGSIITISLNTELHLEHPTGILIEIH